MKSAIVGVCYDKRQRGILEVTLPSWRYYARKHELPLIIVERSYAGSDFYWNKHLLYRVPELRSFERLLFLDNDVFISQSAAPLVETWNSPLIGATCECVQAGWSDEFISNYYDEYCVDRQPLTKPLRIINTGVLVIPREQAPFLEAVYERWKRHISSVDKKHIRSKDPFILSADQPHVSYALQTEGRYVDFGTALNTIWWHWYRRNISRRKMPFLLRSKGAALMQGLLPHLLWRSLFQSEVNTFRRCLGNCHMLHVAGSKSALFLGIDSYNC